MGVAGDRRIRRRTLSGKGDLAEGQGGARSGPVACERDARQLSGAPRRRPTNFRRAPKAIALSDAVKADVARIEAAWAGARETFGKAGPFLYGRFSAADAMFAPVVNRFHAYAVPVGPATRAYMEAIMALPAWKAWIADGEAEPWRIEKYEGY